MDFLEVLKTQGPTIAVLLAGIVTLWTTWRADTKEASAQRELNLAALSVISEAVEDNKKAIEALTTGLEKFFLKHFPE